MSNVSQILYTKDDRRRRADVVELEIGFSSRNCAQIFDEDFFHCFDFRNFFDAARASCRKARKGFNSAKVKKTSVNLIFETSGMVPNNLSTYLPYTSIGVDS